MPYDSSTNFHLLTLKRQHKELSNCINEFIRFIPKAEKEKVNLLYENVFKAAQSLVDSQLEGKCPEWLGSILNAFKSTPLSRDPGQDIVHLLDSIVEARNYSWEEYFESKQDGINFDEIYNQYKQNSNLDQLFDKIIVLLKQLLESEAIDSVKARTSINMLIHTLNNCKTGSFFSLMGGWNFIVSFIKNIILEELKNIPILGTVAKALDEAIKETEVEMNRIQGRISSEVNQKLPFLIHQPIYTSLGGKPLSTIGSSTDLSV